LHPWCLDSRHFPGGQGKNEIHQNFKHFKNTPVNLENLVQVLHQKLRRFQNPWFFRIQHRLETFTQTIVYWNSSLVTGSMFGKFRKLADSSLQPYFSRILTDATKSGIVSLQNIHQSFMGIEESAAGDFGPF